MSTQIRYKGNPVVTFDKGTVTLRTQDSGLEGDIEVVSEGDTSGGGSDFNIAFGDTAPADTSKLWIKTSEPEEVNVTFSPVIANEKIKFGIGTFPLPKEGIASAVIGTKVYLFGGGSRCLDTINVFDAETETLTTLSTRLPTAAENIASAVVGTKVYLFGGRTDGDGRLDTINVFDTETETLTTLSTRLPEIYGMGSAVVGTKVYLFGGYSGGSKKGYIMVFETTSNAITMLSERLPSDSVYISAEAVGTNIYLFGASSGGAVVVFDTTNLTVSKLDVSRRGSGISAGAIGTKIYLFGGYDSNYVSTINVFDTENNTIQTLSAKLPTAAARIASAVVGTKVYLFGGYSNQGGYLDTINVFIVQMPLAANNMLIEASATKNMFNLLPTLELGVNAVYLGNTEGYGEKVPAALYVDGAWREI